MKRFNLFNFKSMQIENLGKGCVEDKKDNRDYDYEKLCGAGEPVDWSKPFNVEDKLSKPLEVFDQKSSDACVGCAFSYYLEVLEDIESKKFTDLSPRDIFSRIYLKYGAYLRDGAKIAVGRGVCEERLAPCPNPTKTSMRVIPVGVDENALKFQSKSYATLTTSNNIDKLAEIIRDNNGCVSGVIGSNWKWKTGFPKPPARRDDTFNWAHALYFTSYQMHKGKKLIGFINSWGCYDDKTEILTKDGWKLFKDINKNEIVATLNPKSNNLEYNKISKKLEYEYENTLFHYTGRDIDLMVTPNHKIYFKPACKNSKWKIEEAQEIKIKHFKMKKNAIWNGEEKKYKKIGSHKIKMDDWLEFLGYFISEGHTNSCSFNRKGRTRIRNNHLIFEKEYKQTSYITGISQSNNKNNGKNVSKIQKCLDTLPFSFCRNGKDWTTNLKILFEELEPLGKSYQKYIPNYIKNLSDRQLKILYDALMLGDGSYSKGKTGEKATYYTSSKKLANDFQELLLKIGYAGDISFTNRIGRNISNKKGKNITNHIEYRIGIKRKELEPRKVPEGFIPKKIEYEGKVYCVTVPNHIIYVRRNGKAVWSGNSDWGFNGRGWLSEDYFNKGLLFNSRTLIDKPTNNKKMKLIIDNNKDQYLVEEESKFAVSIADEKMLEEITSHFAKSGIELEAPILTEMTGYFILHGASGLRWKNFLNL